MPFIVVEETAETAETYALCKPFRFYGAILLTGCHQNPLKANSWQQA